MATGPIDLVGTSFSKGTPKLPIGHAHCNNCTFVSQPILKYQQELDSNIWESVDVRSSGALSY